MDTAAVPLASSFMQDGGGPAIIVARDSKSWCRSCGEHGGVVSIGKVIVPNATLNGRSERFRVRCCVQKERKSLNRCCLFRQPASRLHPADSGLYIGNRDGGRGGYIRIGCVFCLLLLQPMCAGRGVFG